MTTALSGRWIPGMENANVAVWIPIAGYAIAAMLCALCADREHKNGSRHHFWRYAALLMVFLCISRQLDLQTWFTQTGRGMAFAEGWYLRRRIVQFAFIVVLAAGGLAAQIWLYKKLRGLGTEVRWAALGLVFLTIFIVIRTVSLHYIDALLYISFAGIRLNWILELSGIGCVAAAAFKRLNQLPVSGPEVVKTFKSGTVFHMKSPAVIIALGVGIGVLSALPLALHVAFGPKDGNPIAWDCWQ